MPQSGDIVPSQRETSGRSARRFYVYVYLDPRYPGKFKYGKYEFDYEPFYVGKGTGKRKFAHLDEARKGIKHPKNNQIKAIWNAGLEPIILEVFSGLTEEEALEKEKELIATIGRYELGQGPLHNLTPGGDGVSGEGLPSEIRKKRFGRKFDEETRKKIGSRYYPRGPEHPNWGRKWSEETRRKIGEKSRGRRHSEETKRKISEKLKGRKMPKEAIEKRVKTRKEKLAKGLIRITKGMKVHTEEGLRQRTIRMIVKILDKLNELSLPCTEENYERVRKEYYPNSYPTWKTYLRKYKDYIEPPGKTGGE